MGLNSFVATSDGQLIENPRHLRKNEKHLKRIQRQLSRKQKGSKNRLKAKNKLSKAHLKVANQRKDFLHKTSNTLVQQNNIIIAEDLQVKNMTKNHCLAKSIHDAGWSRSLAIWNTKLKSTVNALFKYHPIIHPNFVFAAPMSQKT